MFFEKVNYKFFAFPDEDENALSTYASYNPFWTKSVFDFLYKVIKVIGISAMIRNHRESLQDPTNPNTDKTNYWLFFRLNYWYVLEFSIPNTVYTSTTPVTPRHHHFLGAFINSNNLE